MPTNFMAPGMLSNKTEHSALQSVSIVAGIATGAHAGKLLGGGGGGVCPFKFLYVIGT
jgi:galactokinase/mevalonate kinase-like predicted kinase